MSRNSATAIHWIAVLITTHAFAQDNRSFRLRGEIAGGPRDHSNLSVELTDQINRRRLECVLVAPDGSFELSQVPGGRYRIRIMSTGGQLWKDEPLDVNQLTGNLTFVLPEEKQEIGLGGTVSVTRLEHKIPSKAKKAFVEASKRVQSGDPGGSVAMLRKAIELDPEYLEAYNNLGCRLLNLERPIEAVEALQKAISIDPRAPFVHGNLAAALLFLQRPKEAELEARRAIETDGGSSKTRYLLGMSLYQQRKFTQETLQSLRQAEGEFTNARLALAGVLEGMGDVKEAKLELNTYLSSGAPERRTEVSAWLSRLK